MPEPRRAGCNSCAREPTIHPRPGSDASSCAGTTGKRAYARGSEALLGVAEPKLPALGGHDEERVEALLACGWLEPRAGDVDRDVGNPRLALASPVTREALLRRRVEEITDHLRARGARRRDKGRPVRRTEIGVVHDDGPSGGQSLRDERELAAVAVPRAAHQVLAHVGVAGE